MDKKRKNTPKAKTLQGENDKKALGLALIAQLMLYVVQAFFLGEVGEDDMRLYYLANLLSTVLVFYLPVVFYGRVSGYVPFRYEKREKPKREGFFAKNTVLLYVFGLAATVTAVNIFGTLTELIMAKAGLAITENGVESYIFLFLKSVLFAAVLEELLFRGAIGHAYAGYDGKKVVLISALLFALMHYNFAAFPYAFAAGCVLMFFRLGTGSLLFTVILHFGQNFVTFLFALAEERLSEKAAKNLSAGLFVFFLILTVIGALVYLCSEKKEKPKDKNPKNEKKGGVFCTSVAVYCIAAFLFSLLLFVAVYF